MTFPSWYGLACRRPDESQADPGPWPSVDLDPDEPTEPGQRPARRPEPEPYRGPEDPDLDF